MKKFNLFLNLTMLVILTVLVSCSKERKESLPYKETQGLSKVNDVSKMRHTISTGAFFAGSEYNSNTENLHIEHEGNDHVLGIDGIKFVNYKTDSPFIKDLPIRGKQNFKYEVRYELTETFLHVYKVSEIVNIPTIERSYAKVFANGKVGVPLGGFKISSLMKKINDKDETTGEKSHKQKLIKVSSVDDADYYEINHNAFIRFQEAEKSDIFPADVFDGEWYYAATIVSASGKNKNMIGRDMSQDFKASAVSRVKFVKAKNYVRAVNLNVDENLNTNDDINLESTIVLPVEWLDIRRSRYGDQDQMYDVLLDNNNVDSNKWNKRKFMKIKFTEAKSSISNGEDKNVQFEDLRLTNDFISFTLFYENAGFKVRYALRKAPSKPKKGRIYLKEDRRVYGIFPTEKKHYDDTYRVYREEDKEKFKLINRFMPEDGKIVFRFTHGSEQKHRYAGRESVRVWNEAFDKAGTGIKVVVDESFDVDLGDIRYNAINIVDEVDEGGLLGYGPSIVDTASGEIISATANIYVNPIRESSVSSLRNYVKSQLGLLDEKYIGTTDLGISSPDPKDTLSILAKTIDVKKLTDRNKELYTSELDKLSDKASNLLANRFSSCSSYGTSNAEIIRRVKNICPELNDYITELKGADVLKPFNDNELSYLEPCAEKLIPLETLETMVHEMGHNFGLRHNFIGSTDKDNFYALTEKSELIPQTYVEELKKNSNLTLDLPTLAKEAIDAGDIYEATASTVMEYMPSNKRRLLRPGAYDVEAIRFSYANAVTVNENGAEKVIKLDDPARTIDETIEMKLGSSGSRKKIKFCTDEHVNLVTPLCQRHDAGITPEEIVDNAIMSFNQIYALMNHKHDRRKSMNPYSILNRVIGRVLIPLKSIHDQWRFHLMEFVGKDNKYLEKFDKESFEKVVLTRMATNPKFSELHELWQPAAKKAYNFLKKLAFLSDKYCVIENAEGIKELKAFSQVQDETYSQTRETIHSCMDELAAVTIAADSKFVKEVGHSFKDIKKDLDMNAINLNWGSNGTELEDTAVLVGTEMVRDIALKLLTMRATFITNMTLINFAPNFIDDPILRTDLASSIDNRVLKGQSIKDLGLDPKEFGEFGTQFSVEKDIIALLFGTFKAGLNVPDNVEASAKRIEPYSVIVSQIASQVQGAPGLTKFGEYYLAAPSEESVAYTLINKREEIKLIESKSSLQGVAGINAELLIQQLNFAPKTKEEAMAMKVKEYFATFEQINAVIASPQNPEEVKEGIRIFLQGDLALIGLVNSQSKEFIAKVIEMTMQEMFDAYLNPEMAKMLYFSENLENLDTTFSADAKALMNKVNDFNKNRSEYEAQMETLARTLLNLAR